MSEGVDLHRRQWLMGAAALLIAGGCQRQPATIIVPPGTRKFESAHYLADSCADEADTHAALAAAESLYRAYHAFFALPIATTLASKHRVVLYRDRAQFKQFNQSRRWAEAYYLAPACHAYYDRTQANPHHWMIHEATHQLSREVSKFPRQRWSDEGLGSYFGASRLIDGELRLGQPDNTAYPLWWLSDLQLSGDLQRDIRERRIIALHALVSGQGGPPFDEAFNAYYLGYWSLTAFLLHGEGGRHADAYRQLLARGGSLDNFQALLGPIEDIQQRWYVFLRAGLSGA
ncbi:MAG TPA: hypothetical protein VM469_03875 [Pseudoxanthomonas sp.]|jgi:hypothetical protein|nr:hypothetical protein [Pseudoxanthomonas sp.]